MSENAGFYLMHVCESIRRLYLVHSNLLPELRYLGEVPTYFRHSAIASTTSLRYYSRSSIPASQIASPTLSSDMRLINVKTYKFEEFPEHNLPPYAILSHTWGNNAEELSFHDVENGRTAKPGVGSAKLKGCCEQASREHIGYVWIDTCCINKANLVELSEAINSMFRWYQRAPACYAYLSDVSAPDDPRTEGSEFRASRWFRRGWTLQELLAPRRVVFYDAEWRRIGSKTQLRTVIEDVTRIPQRFLTGSSSDVLSSASVAQRMSWAASRKTTREEDLAYCLIGLFGISMPMIYGEGGDRAFVRLQEEIMRSITDHSILAWGLSGPVGDSGRKYPQTGGFLATKPTSFANSGHIVPRDLYTRNLDILDVVGGNLRVSLSVLRDTPTQQLMGLLNCGPEGDTRQVVGIPLAKAMSRGSNEYVRLPVAPQLHVTAASDASREPIYIKNDYEAGTQLGNQQGWYYDACDFADIGLDVMDVAPRHCWDQGQSIIIPGMKPDSSPESLIAMRLRHDMEGSRDFILALEFQPRHAHFEATQYCVMTCSRSAPMEELVVRIPSVVETAAGRKTASNGLLHLQLTLEPAPGQGGLFDIRPEAMPCAPDVSVDLDAGLSTQPLAGPDTGDEDTRAGVPGHQEASRPQGLTINTKDMMDISVSLLAKVRKDAESRRDHYNGVAAEQLLAENRLLAEARTDAESQRDHYKAVIAERDAEIKSLKRELEKVKLQFFSLKF